VNKCAFVSQIAAKKNAQLLCVVRRQELGMIATEPSG
jgi:hypothetical protein